MNKGIFITGTDTGVGKTFVSVGLIKALKERGHSVCPVKPLETGSRIRKGKLIPQDTIRLMKASGVDEPIDIINPYRLKHALAPSVAAEIEDLRINKRRIFSAYNQLSKRYEITIVEGAGGIMVPIYKKYLFLDFAKDLNLHTVIVSRPGLGTINHTLLTIEAARSRGLDIIGVIINYAVKTKKGLSEKTNPEVIGYIGGLPILGIIPYTESLGTPYIRKIFSRIAEKLLN